MCPIGPWAQLSVRGERLSDPAPGPREKAPLPFQGRQAPAHKSQPPGGRPPPSTSAQSALGLEPPGAAPGGGAAWGGAAGGPSWDICIFLGVRTGGNRRPSDLQNPRAASGGAQERLGLRPLQGLGSQTRKGSLWAGRAWSWQDGNRKASSLEPSFTTSRHGGPGNDSPASSGGDFESQHENSAASLILPPGVTETPAVQG